MQGDLNPMFPKGVNALCGNEQSCTPVVGLGCSQRWVTSLKSGVIAGKKKKTGHVRSLKKTVGLMLRGGSHGKTHNDGMLSPALLEKDSKNSPIGQNGLVGKKWLTRLVLE